MKLENITIKSKLYNYSVEFIDNFYETISEFEGNYTYIIDRNVYEIYNKDLSKINKDYIYFVDAIESKKNMNTVLDVIDFWKGISVKKDWKVICLGGGITQDITTIASNLYLRNIDWYYFPTTLLSMCDSCIGGKCGINLGEYKNQIGVFYPPKKIFIDKNFINTLTYGDYINGWGEIFKFSLTDNFDFYYELKNENVFVPCDRIEEYIYKGLLIKKMVIEADEFESDYRRVLNYGHTFGHALEAYSHNQIPHGQAVIWGIDVANYIAFKENLITKDCYLDIKSVIKNAFIKDEIIVDDSSRLFDIIKTDKKANKKTIGLALLNGDSHLIVYQMAIDHYLKQLFFDYLEETHEYYSN